MNNIKQLSAEEVRLRLRLHITEHFDTKTNFAKHIGVSCTFLTFLTTKDKDKQKPIPDYILRMIGISRHVTYTEDTPK